jgi:uncharacterized protein YkwD
MNLTIITTAINILRAFHGAPPLVISSNLTYIAGLWSNFMAGTNLFMHSPSPYGENIAYSGNDAISMFYHEIVHYNASNPFESAGHFSQLVWKSTLKYGIAVVKNKNRAYTTMEFDPPGNVYGQYHMNVQMP